MELNRYLVHLNNLNGQLCAAHEQQSGLHEDIVKMLLEDGYEHHHSASAPGYMSRLTPAKIEIYKGRFGKGLIVHSPSWRSNQYHNVDYYLRREE